MLLELLLSIGVLTFVLFGLALDALEDVSRLDELWIGLGDARCLPMLIFLYRLVSFGRVVSSAPWLSGIIYLV